MKLPKIFYKNNKGFSLIELMVVVGIISILAIIAIPSYNGFQAKARQGEAKTSLGGYFMSMEATKVETGTYVGHTFAGIGFNPKGSLNYRVTGVDAAGTGAGSVAACTQTGKGSTCTAGTANACTNAGGTQTACPSNGVCPFVYQTSACKKAYSANFSENPDGDPGKTIGPAAPQGFTGWTQTANEFVAVASGIVDLSLTGTAATNTWSIDQNKSLIEVQ